MPLTQIFLQYSYLQILDFLTTVAFLVHGVQEGNPLVRWALVSAPSPLVGLLVVKFLGLVLGFYCWHTGKVKLLMRINIAFALLVAWNLISLIVRGGV